MTEGHNGHNGHNRMAVEALEPLIEAIVASAPVVLAWKRGASAIGREWIEALEAGAPLDTLAPPETLEGDWGAAGVIAERLVAGFREHDLHELAATFDALGVLLAFVAPNMEEMGVV